MAWLLLLFFRAAVAFGIPLQLAVHLLPPGNGLEALGGPLVGCAAALGGYVLAVRLGEGRWAGELALRRRCPGSQSGAVLGLALMAVLMGAMVVTGLYDITLVGGARCGRDSAWRCRWPSRRSSGCARCCSGCCGGRSDPYRPSPSRPWSSARCTWPTQLRPIRRGKVSEVQGCDRRVGHQGGFADLGEFDPPDAAREAGSEVRGNPNSQAGLPDASGADEADQASVGQRLSNFRQLRGGVRRSLSPGRERCGSGAWAWPR